MEILAKHIIPILIQKDFHHCFIQLLRRNGQPSEFTDYGKNGLPIPF
jgi:hypothetical protein